MERLSGSVIFLLITPAKPPRLIPFLSLVPSIIRLNCSVVDNKPKPEPSIALPRIPNGPKNKLPNTAAPRLGNAFLIAAFLSLFKKPDSSPNNISCIFWLFFKKEAPAPSMIPPTGPNGAIRPANPPTIPYFLASGKYFFKLSTILRGITPS